MTKTYRLKGLDCASCAAKIEKNIQELTGVDDANVSFATGTLKLQVAPEMSGRVEHSIRKIVNELEPGVRVINTDAAPEHDLDHEHHGGMDLVFLAAGALLFLITVILDYLGYLSPSMPFYLYLVAYAILGAPVLSQAVKNILRGNVFDENFLMGIATIGAFAIGEYAEGVGVMLFWQIGEFFQGLAVQRSKKSIADLMNIRPEEATVIRDGELITVNPEMVNIGEHLIVKPGERVPLDGVVIEGASYLDTSALTGEAAPRAVAEKDTILAGMINLNGVLTIEVKTLFADSTVAKILNLVENASHKKAPTENFITKFARYYTPIVVGLAALLMLVPPLLLGGVWSEWINRGLIFLVISCPCALVISIPLSFFGGIGGASKHGVLVKGGNYLEALNKIDTVVFDKTGTLTEGSFKVHDVVPVAPVTQDELWHLAALVESYSNHPIAQSIVESYTGALAKADVSDYEELAGHGIRAVVNERTVLAGNERLMQAERVDYEPVQAPGSIIYLAIDGKYAGHIVVSDSIKVDSKDALKRLKERGIRQTIMLTGDRRDVAAKMAAELGIDHVYSELLPDMKVTKLEALQVAGQDGHIVFVGDGINDAPVLARADIGVAMGGLGSDAAIEAADVVLMTDEPSKLVTAIDIARYTRRIVWQNIVFAMVVKLGFLLLGALGVATMWEAVFADVGVALIAILNAMRILKMKFR